MPTLYTNELKNFCDSARRNNPEWGMSSNYRFYKKNNLGLSHIQLAHLLRPKSIMDFGCGPGGILNDFPGVTTVGYDPFIDQFNTYPTGKFDLIVSHYVLHLIEEVYYNDTVELLRSSCNKNLVATIILTGKTDRFEKWYQERFSKFFRVDLICRGAPIHMKNYENKDHTITPMTIWCST